MSVVVLDNFGKLSIEIQNLLHISRYAIIPLHENLYFAVGIHVVL